MHGISPSSFLLFRTEICNDQEILKKQRWTLKVEPVNGALRTYYMSVGSKRELYVSFPCFVLSDRF